MTKRQIILFTGEIQTGKSAHLLDWCADKNALGFVTPTINGKKVLHDVASAKQSPYELDALSENAIAIGRYFLHAAAFANAYNIIEKAITAQPDWIVLDEIGKLELRNEGHHRAIELLLETSNSNLLFVVRNSLLTEVETKYIRSSDFSRNTHLKL
jgi:nucleoside-triphosphatase